MTRPLALSIADWLVPWRALDWPIDWARVFGREAPLALEIGFGNGAFLEREARRRPDRNHLGIELSWTSATHLFRRLDKGGAPHARALLCDAEVALAHLIAPGALTEIFVNHPCPWPKDRHAERRLLRPGVIARLADRAAPGAPLLIVTDHAAYAAEVGATLEAQSAFEPAQGATEVASIPGREPTKYQAKAMAAGVAIHYFPWRRAAAPREPVAPPEPLPALRAGDPSLMPSVTLLGRAGGADLLDGFEPEVEQSAPRGVPTVVKLAAAWRAARGDAWLVEALVKEDRLQQDLALEVTRRDGRTVIRLSHLGHPHPTFGVRRAVWLLAARIARRHPELRVEHHTLGDAAEAAPA